MNLIIVNKNTFCLVIIRVSGRNFNLEEEISFILRERLHYWKVAWEWTGIYSKFILLIIKFWVDIFVNTSCYDITVPSV